MRLLRDNKETLLSVLEPFLRDPTVAWGRSGRAQRSEIAATASTSTFLSRAGVARMRQTRLSSPDQGGDIRIYCLLFSLCVALRSHVRPLTHKP